MKDYLKPYMDTLTKARDRAEEIRKQADEMQKEIDALEQAAKDTDDYSVFLDNKNKAEFLKNRLEAFRNENKADFSFDFSGIIDEIKADYEKESKALNRDFLEDYTRMKNNHFRHLEEIDNMKTALKAIEQHQPHGLSVGYVTTFKRYIEDGSSLAYQAGKK